MVPNGMKYIDNFIEDPEVEKLLVEKFTGNDFPWFYSSHVAYGGEKNSSFYFVHMFYREGKQQSDLFDLLHPVLGRLKFNHLLNIRANCYTKTEKPFTHDWHVDRKHPHKVALFGLNTNNGFTEFKDTGEKVQSKKNRMLLFDGELHRSTTQTDTDLRINININYV